MCSSRETFDQSINQTTALHGQNDLYSILSLLECSVLLLPPPHTGTQGSPFQVSVVYDIDTEAFEGSGYDHCLSKPARPSNGTEAHAGDVCVLFIQT